MNKVSAPEVISSLIKDKLILSKQLNEKDIIIKNLKKQLSKYERSIL
jgi:hypothetical protein